MQERNLRSQGMHQQDRISRNTRYILEQLNFRHIQTCNFGKVFTTGPFIPYSSQSSNARAALTETFARLSKKTIWRKIDLNIKLVKLDTVVWGLN